MNKIRFLIAISAVLSLTACASNSELTTRYTNDSLTKLTIKSYETKSADAIIPAFGWDNRDAVAAMGAVQYLSKAEAEKLLPYLECANDDVALALMCQLALKGIKQVKPIALQFMNAPSDSQQLLAIQAISDIGETESCMDILFKRASENKRSSWHALMALATCDSKKIDDIVGSKLENGTGAEKITAMKLAFERNTKDITSSLEKLTASKDKPVAFEAFSMLGKFAEKGDINLIEKAYLNADSQTAPQAEQMLLNFSDKYELADVFEKFLKGLKPSADWQKKSIDSLLKRLAPPPTLYFLSNAFSPDGSFFNEEQLKNAISYGVNGIAPTNGGLKMAQKTIDSGIDVPAIYCSFKIKKDHTIEWKNREQLIDFCAKNKTILWPTVYMEKGIEPWDKAYIDDLVKYMKKLAQDCAKKGVTVSLYPHVNLFVETLGQTMHVVKAANEPNLFATFNYYHSYTRGESTRADYVLKNIDKINLITINGVNEARPARESSIEPLGSGNRNTEILLRTLLKSGYKGPVIIQGHRVYIEIPPESSVKQSMQTWRNIHRTL